MSHPVATEKPSPLVGPEERPDADVVIYDGRCRMCVGQTLRLARLDCGGRLAFLSLHDGRVPQLYPDLSHEALMRDMYVVDRRGRRHRGAAAVRYLSRRLPRLWWLAPLLHLPGTLPLWQWMYQQVAQRRYQFGTIEACDDEACAVHRHQEHK
jgi:predicted DCC family thiol-disulfide oxidoreductase YuxK